jgi:hypothetical protein
MTGRNERMTRMQKIEQRLAKLERQKSYIFGMWLAEHAHSRKMGENDAIKASWSLFKGTNRSLILKGYRSQANAIKKEMAKAEQEQSNLFSMAIP